MSMATAILTITAMRMATITPMIIMAMVMTMATATTITTMMIIPTIITATAGFTTTARARRAHRSPA
jgi:hypothetical protein